MFTGALVSEFHIVERLLQGQMKNTMNSQTPSWAQTAPNPAFVGVWEYLGIWLPLKLVKSQE